MPINIGNYLYYSTRCCSLFMSLVEKIKNLLLIDDTKRKIVSNLYWALLGKIVSLISTLIVGIIVARYLGPDRYGLMTYVVSFVSIFQIVSNFGLDNIEIREEAKEIEKANIVLGSAFFMRLVFSVFSIFLIVGVAIIYEADSYTIELISLYSLSILFTAFDVIRNYFTAIVLNKYVVKVTIFRNIISLLIKLILVYLNANLTWFILVLIFDYLITANGYYMSYKKFGMSLLDWKINKEMIRYLMVESYPLFLSGLAATVFLQIDQLMIGNMINKTSVGYYSVAAQLVAILMFVPNILIQTITPILVNCRENSIEQYKIRSQQFMDITVWSCIILAITVSLSSGLIIKLLYGPLYFNSALLLSILSYKLIGSALNVISGQLLIIDGNQKLFLLRSCGGAIVCVLLNYFMIKDYGVIGCAVVSVVTQLVAGWLIHMVIPRYRYMFNMQTLSLVKGWKELFYVVRNIRNGYKSNY